MSYIDNNLLPDEQVTYRSQLHWVIFMRPLLWLIATVAVYWYLEFHNDRIAGFVNSSHMSMLNFYQYLPLIPLVMTVFTGLFNYLAFISTEFGVTNKRVIVKVGFISRTTSENFLQKVENVQVLQSVWGRILGFGTIILHGTGGTREPFDLIDNPLEFRRKVQEQVDKVLEK